MGLETQMLTLTTVVVDVRVVRIVLDCLLEALEGHRRLPTLHVDTGKLYPALCHRWYKSDSRLQIRPGAIDFTAQESRNSQ